MKPLNRLLNILSDKPENSWDEMKKIRYFRYFNFSKFPYSQISKSILMDYLFYHFYKDYDTDQRGYYKKYDLGGDFGDFNLGIKFDVILDILEKIDNYIKIMLKNKDERFVLMEDIPNNLNSIYFYYISYKEIPKFRIPISYEENFENYDSFKKRILQLNNSKYLESIIKSVIYLLAVYQKNKTSIDNFLKENIDGVGKVLYIFNWIIPLLRFEFWSSSGYYKYLFTYGIDEIFKSYLRDFPVHATHEFARTYGIELIFHEGYTLYDVDSGLFKETYEIVKFFRENVNKNKIYEYKLKKNKKNILNYF